jgi:hypothetical protein
VYLYVYTLIVARQRLSKHIPEVMNAGNNRKIVGRVVFYTVRDISKESLWVCHCIPSFTTCTAEAVVWRLPEPPDSEPRITVLARASSNLLDWNRLCIPLSLLCNGSVITFLRQWKILGGVVSYAVRLVSKESMRLVFTRTSCNLWSRKINY